MSPALRRFASALLALLFGWAVGLGLLQLAAAWPWPILGALALAALAGALSGSRR
jgi:hypothetical protein